MKNFHTDDIPSLVICDMRGVCFGCGGAGDISARSNASAFLMACAGPATSRDDAIESLRAAACFNQELYIDVGVVGRSQWFTIPCISRTVGNSQEPIEMGLFHSLEVEKRNLKRCIGFCASTRASTSIRPPESIHHFIPLCPLWGSFHCSFPTANAFQG